MRHIFRDFVVVLLGAWTLLATSLRRLVRGPKHPQWSYRFELVAEVMRAVLRLGYNYMSIQLRRKQPTPPLFGELARRTRVQHTTIAGVSTETLTPVAWKTGDPTWVHFHGGAYSMCTPGTHRNLLARIALRSGVRCVVPNYRKAPEHPYPAPIDDCEGVYRALLDEGVDNIILGGDSAGGGLALAVLQRLRSAGLPMPRAAVLMSPWVDLTASGGSIESNRPFDYLAGEMLVMARGEYLAGADPASPEVSPIFADLTAMPPMLVQSGGAELFLDQNRHFVERAREAGVDVTHEVSEGMVHVFQLFAPFPSARNAVRSIGKFVTTQVASQAPSL